MSDVTLLLNEICQGDSTAADRLLPLVYDELRTLAACRMHRERPDITLQATALVHEAYLRLVGNGSRVSWDSRAHFFGAAAEAMRRILVDAARHRSRLKRGGGAQHVRLVDVEINSKLDPDEILAVHDALDRLEEVQPQAARLVKLRYFAGFTIPEAAEMLEVSPRKANQLWAYAKAWLLDAMAD